MDKQKKGMGQIEKGYFVDKFSAGDFCSDIKRAELEKRYKGITEITDKFSRQSVSYQLSKKSSVHRWLKYKEGFSEELVQIFLDEIMRDNKNQDIQILDPFLGSGTTAMVCKMSGIDSIGLDILPTSKVSIDAKMAIFKYNIEELRSLVTEAADIECPEDMEVNVNYITITESAYPVETEKELTFYSQWLETAEYSAEAKNLVILAILNSLERISYTVKDGQYLRWDYRSEKVISANKKRAEKGKPPLKKKDKGPLPTLKQVMCEELKNIVADIEDIREESVSEQACDFRFIQGSALYELPGLGAETINGVITSPPYCNRYDYTRTYALELAYLGYTIETIKDLRQSLLSCTVENKTKLNDLKEYYQAINRAEDYERVCSLVNSNEVLKEIMTALNARGANKELNNKGVIGMVEGYFTELTFVFFELYRLCRSGAKVVFVNDNVRYGGEVIPVDYLSTYIAESIGFVPKKIYTLKQQKGNSSQQMKKYGRVALRKSITVWEKA